MRSKVGLILILFAGLVLPAGAQRFYPDDPL